MAYYQGNLALDQRNARRTNESPKQQPVKVVYRKSNMPINEKLMYLATIAMGVFVAGLIIWQYTQIYETNASIYKTNAQIEQLRDENEALKQKIAKSMDPKELTKKMQAMGEQYIPQAEGDRIRELMSGETAGTQDVAAQME